MPVTAKLSRKFYDQFGDQVVTELVDLLNQVDADSHSSLRELNELNFARFDARSGERQAQLRADFETRMAEGFSVMDRRLNQLRSDLETKMAEGFALTDGRLNQVRSDLETKIGELRQDMISGFAHSERRMVHWFLGLWLAQTLVFLTVWLGQR